MSGVLFAKSLSARHQRARLIFECSERLAGPPAAARHAIELTRLDLYRQAAYWGLLGGTPGQEHLTWPALLAGVRGVPEQSKALLASSVEDDEALDQSALVSALEQVRATALSALETAETPERLVAARHHWKVVRQAVAAMAILAFVPIAVVASTKLVDRVDLAKGKPWRASTKFADCHPERIECAGVRTHIFFHTLSEKEPWVEIDLQTATTFSTVAVHNRSDSLQDRAVPLVLEVSDDQKTWRELARQDAEFKLWKAKVPPTTARYVRLRATRETLLHLDAVKVHP